MCPHDRWIRGGHSGRRFQLKWPRKSVDPFDGCDTDLDAYTGFDAPADLNTLSDLDAHTGFDALIDLNPHVPDPYVDLKCIVDDLLMSPSHEARTSASEDGTSHLTDDGWAEAQKADDPINLDEMNAVKDEFARVRSKGDEVESIPGLLGTDRWRRLKGGVTMDSGCSIDTMPVGHAPSIEMGPVPVKRLNRRINAANGARIKEHGVKQLKFCTRNGKRQASRMFVTDVKKAFKSVATTCDSQTVVNATFCLPVMEAQYQ